MPTQSMGKGQGAVLTPHKDRRFLRKSPRFAHAHRSHSEDGLRRPLHLSTLREASRRLRLVGRPGLECCLLAQFEYRDVAGLVVMGVGVRRDQLVLADLDSGGSL
jgi:hypothetical protein